MKKRIYSLIFILLLGRSAFPDALQLETVGTQLMSNLYMTYVSLGVIGDSYSKMVYEKEQTIGMVEIIITHSMVQRETVARLMKSGGISDTDRAILRDAVMCYQYLIDEGKYMIEVINNNNDESLKLYNSNRQNAWMLISKLLGFDGR